MLLGQEKQGYYITTTGEKVEGYFKQSDFNNPDNLYFKTLPNEQFRQLDKENLREYGIENMYKYIRRTVNVDLSEMNDLKRMANNKNPVYSKAELFLNIIAEGAASLYSAKVGTSTAFFYSLNSQDEIKQLIYKKYISSAANSKVEENNLYRQQLYENLNCGNRPVKEFTTIRYTKSDLLNTVKAYNDCSGSTTVAYTNKGSNEYQLKYRIYAGAATVDFSVEDALVKGQEDNAGSSIAAGFEVALRSPSKRWEYFAIFEYQKIKAEVVGFRYQNFNTTRSNYDMDARAFNLYFGARYNLYFSKNNKIFADAAFGLCRTSGDIYIKTEIVPNTSPAYTIIDQNFTLGVRYSNTWRFGTGYEFKDKYAVMANLETDKEIGAMSQSQVALNGLISRLMLSFRYTFN
ncbi:hypothetical protein CHU92_10040 [Flavobacterium cyanobacteriorum]|uniref:Uncharacterized protein n=2 Tax=Flavobacterium cyanobacteriorum TaxID=2022802 RepID=A0A255Z3U4_9FLAO|nr:hypothetical protein CHU92_10040 [Flavobacterium cyanobacteriorum]